MSRGRKHIDLGYTNWEKVFYKNIGLYISLINKELETTIPLEPISKHIKVLGGCAFKSNEYRNDGIPVIRISDFQDEKIDLTSVKYIEENKAFEKYELSPGDIIIAMTGGTIGKLAIIQEGLGKLYLNQRVGKLFVLDPNAFANEYIYWIARGIQDKVKKLGYGGAQPNISNAQIEAMKLPFPAKDLQLKIISFLNDLKNNTLKNEIYFNEAVENEIFKNQKIGVRLATIDSELSNQNSLITQLRQSILQEAVQGKLVPQNPKDEPASVLLEKIKKEKAKLIAEGKLKREKELPPISKEEIPFELPKGWVWCRLGEVIELVSGQHIDAADYNEKGEGIPYLTGPSDFGSINPIFSRWSTSPKVIVKKSDILITVKGSGVGKTNILHQDEVAIGRQLMAIRSIQIERDFLKFFIDSLFDELQSEKSGIAIPGIGREDILNKHLALPPKLEQCRIATKVVELGKTCDALEKEIESQKEQVKTLMQAVLREAFEGGISAAEKDGANKTSSEETDLLMAAEQKQAYKKQKRNAPIS